MFRSTNHDKPDTSTKPAAPKRKLTDERDLMRRSADEVKKASQAIEQIAANVRSLEKVLADADAAEKDVQTLVDADSQSLTAYANGEVDANAEISRKVDKASNLAKAAVVARSALPRAQEHLQNAHAQHEHLIGLQREATRNYVLALANEAARKYMRAYKELCAAYDAIRGISDSLPPLSSTEPTITMSGAPIDVPNFNLPSVRSGSEWIERKIYHGHGYAIEQEAAKWSQAFQRLLDDPEADVDGLLEDEAA